MFDIDKTSRRIVKTWLLLAVIATCYATVPAVRHSLNSFAGDMWAAKKAQDAKLAPCRKP